MSFVFAEQIGEYLPKLVNSLVFRWMARGIWRFWPRQFLFIMSGFLKSGGWLQHSGLARQKSGTRSENLPGFVGSRFYLGFELQHLHVLLNSHFSYSLVDGFCCVLTKLKPPNDSGRKLQHPDFSIRASASGLRHPGSSR